MVIGGPGPETSPMLDCPGGSAHKEGKTGREQSVRKILIVSIAALCVLGISIVASGVTGYYIHKWHLAPIYPLAERAEVKLRRELGLKTDTELAVERIDTIFLSLKGRVFVMPNRTFQNGGGMTVWGDDLIVMHKTGKVLWLARDEKGGLQLSPMQLPDNGYDGYVKLAAEKYPGRVTREDALRYNDIEYVDVPGRRGLILSYTFVDVEHECYRSRVSWLTLPPEVKTIRDLHSKPEDWEIVFDSKPCLEFNPTRELMLAYMAGGRVAFKAPNLVYTGVGDYHREGIYRPDSGIQSDDSDYGKVIEINLDTKTSRHISKGHRNLQGITFDNEGRLWTTEHGMRGGDELNLIEEGENYGWPIENMGTMYNGVAIDGPSGKGRHTIYHPPVFAWVPSAAISSITVVKGFDETWDGDLLISSLKARTLFRARIQDNRLISLEPIPIGQRIRDVQMWGDDRIALWLDLNEVVILEKIERKDPLAGLDAQLVSDGMPQEQASTAIKTLGGCQECHSYESDVVGAGPSLAGVVGREVASTAFDNYTDALRKLGGEWTPERLASFLTTPESMAPGTAMTGHGVGNADLARDLVRALALIKYNPEYAQ